MREFIYATLVAVFLTLTAGCADSNADREMKVVSSLRDVSRLELARMTVGKVGMISDHRYEDARTVAEKTRALVDAMKIGNRIGVYSYDTYLVAYIDLSRLTAEDVSINPENNVASVTLPPVQIMTDGREPSLHEEHYRVTGLRSSIKPEERARLKSQMASEVKKEIAADRVSQRLLREDAERKAVAWFSAMLESWGYAPNVRIGGQSFL